MPVGRVGLDAGSGATGVLANTRREAAEPAVTWRLPRRMFGAGLPGAWPFASVARHYVPGFVGRFGQAVAVSEEVVERLSGHEAFAVERIPSGTNLFWLQPSHPDLTAFRRHMRERGVELGTPRSDGRGFLVGVNETWNRRTSSELVDVFLWAVARS